MSSIQKTLPAGNPQWSGKSEIPPVGSTVQVQHSEWGQVTVKGYVVEDGFLGVVAEPKDPPQWWLDQKKRNRQRHRNVTYFGNEFDA